MHRCADRASSSLSQSARDLNLLTVNYELPPQGGGAGVVMFNLIDALRTIPGVQQTVLCGWDHRLGEPASLPGVALDTVPVTRRSIHQTGLRAILEFLVRGSARLRRYDSSRYDLVHFHFSIPTGLLSAVVPRKPYVCSLHGIDVPGFVQEEAELFQKLTAPLNRRILRGAARLFAPSMQIARMILDVCPHAKIEVIPHGVEADLFVPKQIYPTRARRFVTIARLTPWKRVERLVSAVIELGKKYPDATLDIYGEGEQRAQIEALIREAEAGDRITLHGFSPKDILRQSLKDYDAFVLPSISEAFGVVFLEAMAAGLPVVGFDYGGPAEIITEGVDGLLVKHDSDDALVEALDKLASEPGLAAEMGRNARTAAIERFSWHAIANRYLAAYEDVVASTRS